jgi:N-acyl-D-aspartate/D-glutamate deacylase
MRARARQAYLEGANGPEWPEKAERILIAGVYAAELKGVEGQTLAELAAQQKKDPFDALLDLLLADRGNTTRVTFSMGEDDVQAALRHRLVAFCTDSGARAEDGTLSTQKSHPRGWASTARILGHYVRDQKLLPLEEAVRKMTSLPAQRMGLQDRGLIRPGMAADLVVFDLAAVAERSTFAEPNRYAAGFSHVAVNGRLVVDEGRPTEARPGRFLRGPGWRGSQP